MSNFLRGLAVVTLGVLVAAIGWLLLSGCRAASGARRSSRRRLDQIRINAACRGRRADAVLIRDRRRSEPLRLRDSRRIRGRVVDRGGIGIGHAVVRALAQPAGADFDWTALWFTRVPDQPVAADGTFAVVVPIHAPFDLVAEARGFAPGATHLPSRAEGAVEIVMDVPTVIEGTVRAAKVLEPRAPRENRGPHVGVPRSNADRSPTPEGRFVIDDLRGGSASITVAAPGFGTTEDAVELPEAGRFTFSVDLEPGRTARVQAVDMRTRAPVAGAWIAYGSERSTAGDDGVVAMTDLPRRSFAVEVRKSGYLPSSVRFHARGRHARRRFGGRTSPRTPYRRTRDCERRGAGGGGYGLRLALEAERRGDPGDRRSIDSTGSTVSAEDGTYALTTEIDGESRVDVPEGEPATASLFVTARHPAHGNAATRHEVKASATDEETKVDVAIRPSRVLRTRSLRSTATDSPMGRALVELYAIIHRIDEHEYSEVEVPRAPSPSRTPRGASNASGWRPVATPLGCG
jgi:hypothetical protein